MEKLSYDEWEDKYKPIQNTNHSCEMIDFTRKEIQGHDFSFVWSLVHGDFEETIIPGYHIVNVVHFYVTELSHMNAEIEVPFWTEEDEKERLRELIRCYETVSEQELESLSIDDLFSLENKSSDN